MNGVVLWSCPKTWRVIVWCEDHAELAYARGEESFVQGPDFPNVGDLIAFDLHMVDRIRHARAIRVVMRDGFPEIARSLRTEADHTGGMPANMAPEPVPIITSIIPRRPARLAAVG